MPTLWNKTIEAHRREVRDAVLDAAAALVAEQGLLSVTMSEIAERTGIGRATLYKYFPDVKSILLAWHERGVTGHLEHLRQVREKVHDPCDRLKAVLEAYALIELEHHASEQHHSHLGDRALFALLHRGGHVARAHGELRSMVRELIAEAARAGEIRDDVEPAELASYCLHALSAAGSLGSKAAVRRLVSVTLDALSRSPGS